MGKEAEGLPHLPLLERGDHPETHIHARWHISAEMCMADGKPEGQASQQRQPCTLLYRHD